MKELGQAPRSYAKSLLNTDIHSEPVPFFHSLGVVIATRQKVGEITAMTVTLTLPHGIPVSPSPSIMMDAWRPRKRKRPVGEGQNPRKALPGRWGRNLLGLSLS